MGRATLDQNNRPTLIGISTISASTPLEVGVLPISGVNPIAVAIVDQTGAQITSLGTDLQAIKTTTVGSVVYVGMATAGSLQATAAWQCRKIDSSVTDTVVVTWADGNTNFDNVATDLTALSYS